MNQLDGSGMVNARHLESPTRVVDGTIVVDRPIGVLLVDDQRMFVETLEQAFGSDERFRVVGIAKTCAEGLDLAVRLQPDVAVVSSSLPDGTVATLTATIRQGSALTQVLILTAANAGAGDDRAVTTAIAAGCAGFISKDRGFDDLLEAVQRVHAGETFLSTETLSRAMSHLQQQPGNRDLELTDRELEILGCLAEGLSTLAIARRLIVSVNTIRNHVHRILTKLGAHSKLEAVVIATRTGLLPH